TFSAASGAPRALVRRYELDYEAEGTHAYQYARRLLSHVYLTGACANVVEDDQFEVPTSPDCTRQRTIATMRYTGEGNTVGSDIEWSNVHHPGSAFPTFVDLNGDNKADVVYPPERASAPTSSQPMTIAIRTATVYGSPLLMDVQQQRQEFPDWTQITYDLP